MDSSSSNSLISPDARAGLVAPGGGAQAGATDELGGGFAQRFGPLPSLQKMRGNPRLPLILALAVFIAVVGALVLWSRAPDYKVLYSNLSDRDGGEIVAALQAANVPYRLSNGGAILVPSEDVNEMRLHLAAQGLPKSGSVGFALMDNEKFGISQFAEQVNYQRALEGELEQTIESIASVKTARVHLAIPKPSVFVREREVPTASVLVNLFPGRMLDDGQVAAITHMVASAVPDLTAHNITVVDQDGNLLTQTTASAGLDASQLKYVSQVEHDTQSRIDAILAPLFGAGNVRSQVDADVDFSQLEQTSEAYDPNGDPKQAAIRSQQQSTATETAGGGASGVPGALSNQPPQPASAPVNAPAGQNGQPPSTPISDHRDTTTNYELGKTVRHFQQAPGDIKRMSVAVVVNYQPKVDAKGHATMQPLDAQKLAQVEQLVKDAMGYDEKRGDSVNVVNAAFQVEVDPNANLPWWRTPDMIALAKQVATWLGIGVVALFLYFMMVRPAVRRAFPPPEPAKPALPGADFEPQLLGGVPITEKSPEQLESENTLLALENERIRFEHDLDYVRTVARKDPRIVATVIKGWVNDER